MKQEQNENQTSRQMEGAVKVYGSLQMAEEAIYSAQPITAVLDHKNVQAGFKSDVHDIGVVQIIQRHDQLASHISLHR